MTSSPGDEFDLQRRRVRARPHDGTEFVCVPNIRLAHVAAAGETSVRARGTEMVASFMFVDVLPPTEGAR